MFDLTLAVLVTAIVGFFPIMLGVFAAITLAPDTKRIALFSVLAVMVNYAGVWVVLADHQAGQWSIPLNAAALGAVVLVLTSAVGILVRYRNGGALHLEGSGSDDMKWFIDPANPASPLSPLNTANPINTIHTHNP